MGPLAGIKVIEMAGIGPVPLCGMMMADMGAEVYLVERGEGGSPESTMHVSRRDITHTFHHPLKSSSSSSSWCLLFTSIPPFPLLVTTLHASSSSSSSS